eukprot:SAG31_NODE_728_length_12522_cov_13.320534_11_plen_197_part_00
MHYAEAVRLKVQKREGGLLMHAPAYESPQHLARLAGYVREGDWRLVTLQERAMAEANRLKWIEGDDSLKPPYGDFEEPAATDAPTTEDASTKDADAAAALAAAAGRDSYGTTENDGEADTTTPSPDTENTQTPLVRKHTAEAAAAAWRSYRLSHKYSHEYYGNDDASSRKPPRCPLLQSATKCSTYGVERQYQRPS